MGGLGISCRTMPQGTLCSGRSRISHRGGVDLCGGGCGPPMWALFGENVCENERIGSHRGGACAGHAPPRSANVMAFLLYIAEKHTVLLWCSHLTG